MGALPPLRLLPGPFGAAVMNLAFLQGIELTTAQSKLGIPYVYGVTDCEWLTRVVAASIEVTLPPGSAAQFYAFSHVSPPYEIGDLLYFEGAASEEFRPGHCGVNIGGGHMIDAPYTGTVVRVDSWSPTTTEGDMAFYGAIRPALYSPLLSKEVIDLFMFEDPSTGDLYLYGGPDTPHLDPADAALFKAAGIPLLGPMSALWLAQHIPSKVAS